MQVKVKTDKQLRHTPPHSYLNSFLTILLEAVGTVFTMKVKCDLCVFFMNERGSSL